MLKIQNRVCTPESVKVCESYVKADSAFTGSTDVDILFCASDRQMTRTSRYNTSVKTYGDVGIAHIKQFMQYTTPSYVQICKVLYTYIIHVNEKYM